MNVESPTDYAVIIVNYGDPSLVARNIDPAIDADDGALVVLVDNFHSAGARESAESLCQEHGWQFVASENDGFGAGVNRGVAAARSRGHHALITLNPDAVATADVLRDLARHVTRDPRTLVSPFMDTSDGSAHFRGVQVHRGTGRMRSTWSEHDDDPEWANWLSGACLAFNAQTFDLLGGFSEDFFLYWEDVDISWRAAHQGVQLETRPDLRMVHDEGGTQVTGDPRTKSSTYYYFNIRNRILFGRRHLHGSAWARWLLATPRESWQIWLRGGRRQLFTEPDGARAALRGMVDGVTGALRHPPTGSATVAPQPEGVRR